MGLPQKKPKSSKTNVESTQKKETAKGYLTKRERRALRLKSKKHSLVVKKILPLWEVLRRDDTPPERRLELIDKVLSTCQGKMADLCFAHDTARVMESVIQHGSELQRWTVFAELRRCFRLMAKSRYAKFVLIKLVKYGAKEHRVELLKRFRGHVSRLVNHRVACELIDMLYNDYANATQRSALVKELYGNVHALQLAQDQIHALPDVLALHPDKKQTILGNVNVLLVSLATKGLCKYTIVQHLLLEYLQVISHSFHPEPNPASEGTVPSSSFEGILNVDNLTNLCEALVENQVVPMLHTREGVRAALHLLWVSSPRLRKQLVRGLKTCVSSIARNEHGHLFLIGLLDCVDDIVLLEKVVIKEILEELELFCSHPECRKVLVYALSPRDKRHFSPQLQTSIFHLGDNNPYTKKLLGVRALELRTRLLPRLLQLVSTHLMDIFVGSSSLEGRLALEDRGRLVLLAEILVQSAAHNMDLKHLSLTYCRSQTSPSTTDESFLPMNPEEISELQRLRHDALLNLVQKVLVPPFVPSGPGSVLGKRTSQDRDNERMKRHKRAVQLVEQSLSSAGKPAFSMFESKEEEDESMDVVPYDTVHTMPFLERPEGMLFMRRLIQDGRINKDFTFTRLIMKHVPPSNFLAWTRCNRSCFVLVNLYELGDSTTCELIRSALAPHLTEISASPLSGSKILCKHLTMGS